MASRLGPQGRMAVSAPYACLGSNGAQSAFLALYAAFAESWQGSAGKQDAALHRGHAEAVRPQALKGRQFTLGFR
jgi:hypothetical protein